jgi:hypothetical protein
MTCILPAHNEVVHSSSIFRTHQRSEVRGPVGKVLVKKHMCGFPGCGKGYTRFDNLKVHQLNKGHLPNLELEVDFREPP